MKLRGDGLDSLRLFLEAMVKAGKFDRRRLAVRIYRNLHGVGAAVDVVIVTPEEVERYRDTPWLVICPALREGKVVYGA